MSSIQAQNMELVGLLTASCEKMARAGVDFPPVVQEWWAIRQKHLSQLAEQERRERADRIALLKQQRESINSELKELGVTPPEEEHGLVISERDDNA